MLSSDSGKNLAKNLLLEYIRENELLKCKPEEIDSNMNKIVEASNAIYDSVEKHFYGFKQL